MADNGEGVLLQRPNGSSSSSSGENLAAYSGWVYHLGTNSIGHEFCHLRYLLVRGKNILMYKRDPRKEPGHKPIRKGVAGPCLMVEELGRKRVGRMDLYVLKFYNRLNEMKKGEIACTAAGDVRKWMEVFEQAKQQAEFDLLSGSSSRKLSIDDEINLEGHRPRVRRYAKELIKIGKGPEALLQSSNLGNYPHQSNYMDGEVDNAIEAHEWKCIHTTNGMRIFEDISSSKSGKNILLKSVGIVDANLDLVFEMVYNLDKSRRYEWDTVSDHLEVVDTIDGHFDVVYGTYNQNYQDGIDCCGRPKIYDFVFSRQWFRGQDGAYTILQIPTVHKKCPNKPGYHRAKVNPSIWEIKMLKTSSVEANNTKCLVTLMIEVHLGSWLFGNRYFSKLERTVEYAQLCQVAGLREYLGANPALILDSASLIHQKKVPEDIDISGELITEVSDQFYDAIAADESLEEEDSDDEEIDITKGGKVKLKNVSWAIAAFSLKKPAVNASNELDLIQTPVRLETNQLLGSLRQGKNESDSNCWMNAPGNGFMIRGKTYLSDYSKVPGSDPLLKLFAVDWLKAENNINEIASHPNCLVQVPAKPNYSLALYYGSERPIRKGSLLSKFVDGTDAFRSSRFKLIPSVVEGYWMVKRAVGTKACLLGRAVTCRYIRGDNFLEIDVDIGSSSVARSIIGLVLGYVSSIVVDLAILIEAKEEELPEYVLGTVRLNKIKVDSAVPFVAS